MDQAEKPVAARTPRFGLVEQGMHHLGPVHWNLTAPFLYEHAVRRGEGELGLGGAFVANTGRHTGRSPQRQVHRQRCRHARTQSPGATSTSRSTPARFDSLQQRMLAYLQGRELFVQDLYAGADPEYRLPVRVVTDERLAQPVRAQHVHPAAARPSWRISSRTSRSCTRRISRPIPQLDGIRSETFILVNFTDAAGADRRHPLRRRDQEVGVQLSSITVLPTSDVLPMHCSANVGPKGDVRDLLRPLRHRQDDAVGRSRRAP